MTTLLARVKDWAGRLQRDVIALWLAARDRRVPWHAKAMAALVAAYALSPIDLIPDFIPVIGYLDDVLLVPLGIWITVRLIPAPIMADLREQAARREKPRSKLGAALVLAIWIGAAGLIGWYLLGR